MDASPDELITRDGARLTVRPIQPSDKRALLRAFEHLGEESRYRRFLAPIRHLTSSELAYFTELDHRDHEALIALTEDDEIVGVARYVRLQDRPGVAEVAVTVIDDWQGRGVGTQLLELLAQRARGNGVRSFLGVCLSENREMRDLLEELGSGFRSRHVEDDLVELEVDLAEPSEQTASALRVAARGFHGAEPRRR